jgi:hypothetical protein
MPVINERDFPLLPSQTAKRKKGGHAKKPRTPGTRSTLHDLPDELILEILHYLPGIDSDNFQLPTLLSLALTSRRLYRIAIEKIYIGYDSHFCEPYLFLRTLVSKPELAGLVQKLNLTQGPRTLRGTVSYVPTARDKKTLKEGMRTLAIPGWKDWVADCNGDRITDVTVHNMAAYCPTHKTQLKEVRVVAPKSAKWLKYDWERLVSPFSKAGIDFVVQNESDNEEDSSEGWDDASSASSHSSDEVNLYSDED